jgi:hypothetical protein
MLAHIRDRSASSCAQSPWLFQRSTSRSADDGSIVNVPQKAACVFRYSQSDSSDWTTGRFMASDTSADS